MKIKSIKISINEKDMEFKDLTEDQLFNLIHLAKTLENDYPPYYSDKFKTPSSGDPIPNLVYTTCSSFPLLLSF